MIEKYSKGWREVNQRRDRISVGQCVIAIIKRGISIEMEELQEKYPLCKVCRERFNPEDGEGRPDKSFMCHKCIEDMTN